MEVGGKRNTHVFPNDLLQSMAENLPGEDLDILLNVARLRIREAHDDLEKVLAVRLGFGNRERSEAFQVATDAVLLLDSKADSDQRLKQIDRIHAGDVALVLAFPHDTADANAVRGALLKSHGLEVGMDRAPSLRAGELHQTALRFAFLLGPVLGHGIKIAAELQDCLRRVHGVWVESLIMAHTTCLLQGGCANQGWI